MKHQFLRKDPLSYYFIGIIVIFLIVIGGVVGFIGLSYISTERTLQVHALTLKHQTEDNLVALFQSTEDVNENLIMQREDGNPYLENVRIFDTRLRHLVDNTSVETKDPGRREILRSVIANRSTLEIADPQSGITTRYLFIERGVDSSGSDRSRIIELTYTDQPIQDALESNVIYYFLFGLIALVACALVVVIFIRWITLPIRKMVDDVDRIAGGDLDHPLTPPVGAELIQLEESISTMVAGLKDHIRQHQVSEKRFMDIVQLLPQGVFETDLDGNVTFANSMALEAFRFTQDDIRKGVNIFGLLAPQDRDPARQRFQNILQGVKSRGIEVTAIRKDSTTFPMMVYTTAIMDGETPVGTRGGFIDITHLKSVEAEIRKLNQELEQRVTDRTRQLVEVNRNLESFTYSVSHDLRAPLRAISGFSSILQHDLPDIPEIDRKYLNLIQQNAHDMGQLIDDLLGFSRLGQFSLQKKTIFPAALVREVIQDLGTEMNLSKVEFRIGNLPLCVADPVLMRQVMANLLSNAIKFSRTRDRPVVEIGSSIDDGKQVYFVRDNGIGFDMRYADKIFGVFERLHSSEEYEGTGVGLAIVHRIVELHGGKIWAESEVDKGATFYFTCG